MQKGSGLWKDSLRDKEVCEPQELLKDAGFRAFWEVLVARFEPG